METSVVCHSYGRFYQQFYLFLCLDKEFYLFLTKQTRVFDSPCCLFGYCTCMALVLVPPLPSVLLNGVFWRKRKETNTMEQKTAGDREG